VVTLRAAGLREGGDEADVQHPAYSVAAPALRESRIRAIPYFAWDNRTSGDMTVWIREAR
jgi:DUF1680 family protein